MKAQTQNPSQTTTRYQVEWRDTANGWNQIKPILEIEPFARAILGAQRALDTEAGHHRSYRILKLDMTVVHEVAAPNGKPSKSLPKISSAEKLPKNFGAGNF